MLGNDVVQQPIGLLLLHLHVLAVLLRLHVAVETQPVADLELAIEEPDEEEEEDHIEDDLVAELLVSRKHRSRRWPDCCRVPN